MEVPIIYLLQLWLRKESKDHLRNHLFLLSIELR